MSASSQLEHLNVSYCKALTKDFFSMLRDMKLKLKHCQLDGLGPLHSEALCCLESSKASMQHLSIQSVEFVASG